MSVLKRIEENVSSHQQNQCCRNVVKLARALDRLGTVYICGCEDHSSATCCASVEPGYCPTCEAERTLEEVAGE